MEEQALKRVCRHDGWKCYELEGNYTTYVTVRVNLMSVGSIECIVVCCEPNSEILLNADCNM
jgi:hypothetical protein